jgi:squalene cyclase
MSDQVIRDLAIGYIQTNGSAHEKARLEWILNGIPPGDEIICQLCDLQKEDGGFPHALLAGNPSTINETLTAIWKLTDLGMLGSPVVEKSLHYLFATQREDGGWDESPTICSVDPPPWAMPGDLKARLYLSAYAIFWLAASGLAADPAFQKGLEYLLPRQDESGTFYGFRHTTWIAASAFAMAGEGYAGVVQRGLDSLLAIPPIEWEASQLAWALDCLWTAGVPSHQSFVQSALLELVNRQAPDGSWASEDGPAYAVSATVEAIKVLNRYGVISNENPDHAQKDF